MNELIKIENREGIQTVNARDLWEGLGSKQQFADWVKGRIEGFVEGQDFIIHKIMKVQTEGAREIKRPVIEYHLTIDTAKHVAMLEHNDKGREIRQYFIDVENSARKIAIPMTLPEALRAYADEVEEHESTRTLLNDAKPKIEFFDQVTDSTDAVDMSTAAKVLNLGLGRNTLFQILRDEKVFQQNNQPYQAFIDRGYFRTIEQKYIRPDGAISINIKTVVYQRGLDFIRRMLVHRKD